METEKCEVFLVSTGPKKIEVIRVIRYYTDLDLNESRELAESAPRVVWSDVARDIAENMKRDLEQAGAIAEVREDSGIGRAAKDSGTEQGYEVVLEDPGPKVIEVIKIIREYTDHGLKEAKDLAVSAPSTICKGVSREVARNFKQDLEAIGARAEIPGDEIIGWATKDSMKESGYQVVLSDPGPKKIEVIKVIRQYTGLGLVEAKELAESAPGTVWTGVDEEVAEKIKRDLERVGATAQIKSS